MCRASSYLENDIYYKSDDFIAARLLPRLINLLLNLKILNLKGRISPEGINPYVIARTKYIDSIFKDSIKKGFEQALILGAGKPGRMANVQVIYKKLIATSQMKIQESIKITQKKKIYYILDDRGEIKKFRPWLGDMFSFLYDRIMEKSIFPRKFKGSIAKHYDLLKEEYRNIHAKNLLEIATGSGSAAYILNNDNSYTGIDISSGLLLQAVKKFKEKNFHDAEFFIADAINLPFSNEFFDVTVCDLSLNFLGNIESFIKELKRVMKKDSIFYSSVPVPERKDPKVKIHGALYSENQYLKVNGPFCC